MKASCEEAENPTGETSNKTHDSEPLKSSLIRFLRPRRAERNSAESEDAVWVEEGRADAGPALRR